MLLCRDHISQNLAIGSLYYGNNRNINQCCILAADSLFHCKNIATFYNSTSGCKIHIITIIDNNTKTIQPDTGEFTGYAYMGHLRPTAVDATMNDNNVYSPSMKRYGAPCPSCPTQSTPQCRKRSFPTPVVLTVRGEAWVPVVLWM